MESARGFLLLAFAFITFLLYQQWQLEHAPEPVKAESAVIEQQPDGDIPNETPPVVVAENTDIPQESTPQENTASAQLVHLSNDVLDLVIDTRGGDVISATLKKFNIKLNDPEQKVQLLTKTSERTFVAKSGLVGSGSPDTLKDGRAVYQVVSTEEKEDHIQLTLRWQNDQGVVFDKVFTLKKGHYDVKVDYRIKNNSQQAVSYRMFSQFNRDRFVSNAGQSSFGIQAYTGAAYSSEETRYEKYDFDEMDEANLNIKTKAGWIAYLQHYFVSAWIPNQESINEINTQVLERSGISIIRVKQPWVTVAPAAEQSTGAILYLGPKDQEVLAELANGLDLTVDYSIFWWIGQPLYWLLTLFQGVVGNWGLAIILVTITVKLLLYPLANAQYRSFAKMRMLQPKLQQLKERYGEDRQKMSMAMMELYKKEKVNPMGGCLPLIIQMPVFFALYWVLLESYEIRHAPFALWIQDLSAPDPYYILPVLMGASMWAMQKLQPTAATMDPMQQKIMQYLPVMMTVFFVFFPSGLVLYWLVNNLLSITQQLYITNKIEKEYNAKKA
jgi:YidC/Oxa1 family membrane protein insertase